MYTFLESANIQVNLSNQFHALIDLIVCWPVNMLLGSGFKYLFAFTPILG